MDSSKFTGRNQLIERLSSQVGDRNLAIAILKKRGYIEEDGLTLTTIGWSRNMMNAEERAIDRRSRKSGLSPDHFSYNENTNKAVLKSRKK